jgi:copper(I)-binding protein
MKLLIRATQLVLAFSLSIVTVQSFAGSAADLVSVIDPYVRAVPPGQPNSAAFMTLENQDGAAHAVVNATSPVAKVVELHTHIHEGGMMMMRRIDQVDVPANGKAELKPGGLHVMLIGLKQELKPGEMIPLTLEFEDGSEKALKAPVRKIMMKSMGGMKGGMGDMKH